MLQLYFSPMACSLASRIALMEAGLDAHYHQVHLLTKKVVHDDSDFHGASPKGAVPVLVLENGERLTESAAVLQYIADLKPETGLAPRFADSDRYRLQEWLSFIGAEIHKAFLFPTFWYKDDGSLAKPRARIAQTLSVPAAHLAGREFPSATASPSRMPTSPGPCCCCVPQGSTSRNGRPWRPISNACRRAPPCGRRSQPRWRCARPWRRTWRDRLSRPANLTVPQRGH
ncbi:glutathione S-transferase N-terminal domain-containing protein [Bradyrhizobium diazoefficiens]|nr:glutathione S-transferase N-terminal domain-containing protein [Bradyrhizobium diazoefficiens]WLA62506.1 glutathione S-transferase N-terminal domain-containing protein [Bradyrhizobium diazoefficiens]